MNPKQNPEHHADKKSRWLTPLIRAYERFLKIRGHPREIALGMALGLFIGMTPVMGLHMIIAVPLAALFKWSKISAGIGVWITNAVTAPFIYYITWLVGARLIGIEKPSGMDPGQGLTGLYKMLLKAPEIFWAMTIGGIVLGIPLAVAGYYVSYSVLHKYQQGIKEKIVKSKESLVHRKEERKRKKQAAQQAGKLPSSTDGSRSRLN